MAPKLGESVVRDHAVRLVEHLPLGEATEVTNGVNVAKGKVHAVMEAAFGDLLIAKAFEGAEIRHTAMCGEVAREMLSILGESPDQIGLLSIGDIDLPPEARVVADQMIEAGHMHHQKLIEDLGYGYDLTSQGAEKARASMMNYFDKHYGFSKVPGLKEKLVRNSTIIAGGMRGLDDIATAMVRTAALEGKRHRFVHPDNSFGTWHAIAKLRSNDGMSADVHTVPTAQKNLLHLTVTEVDEFYDANPSGDNFNDSWCITPVGNPSGTCMNPNQLSAACERIVNRNPQAKIILDCTYVRTLSKLRARELMEGVINNTMILNRIVFVDSFSKTHGFAGERVGTYFAANNEVFGPIQTVNMTLSAGNGRQKDGLVLALTNPTDEQQQVIDDLHKFWAKERKGLYHYLIGMGKFDHIFDSEQDHINPDQFDEPMGLYVFFKLKPGINGKQVLKETGCLGVETKMGSGKYMRFAVGKIKKPTYAKYLES